MPWLGSFGWLSNARSQEFNPADLAPLLWLKADAITGLSDGDAVATWADSSVNLNNATQATADAKPTYKTGIFNGLPIVRFDGGDYLRTTANINPKPCTIFAVIDVANYAANMGILSQYQAGICIRLRQTSGLMQWYEIGVQNLGDGSTNAIGTTPVVITASYGSAGAIYHRKNGVANGSSTQDTATTISARKLDIGANTAESHFFTGDMAEALVYGSVLTAENCALVEAYLMAKYGIT